MDNYSPQENVDNDDGSRYYKTHDNLLVSGVWVLKSGHGGHDNWQWNNLNVYPTGPAVFLASTQGPGYEDRFWNNTVVQNSGPIVGWPNTRTPANASRCSVINVTGTRVFSKDGTAAKCFNGSSITEEGAGNTVGHLPPDDTVIGWAKELLQM